MPWSIACCRTFSDSCGDSLLSKGTISNFGPPAQFFWLAISATYCQLCRMFCPTGAISPDSGSIKAILTVCAEACPANNAAARVKSAQKSLDALMTPPRVCSLCGPCARCGYADIYWPGEDCIRINYKSLLPAGMFSRQFMLLQMYFAAGQGRTAGSASVPPWIWFHNPPG